MKKIYTMIMVLVMMLFNTAYANESHNSVKELFAVMGMENQLQGGFEAMLPVVDQLAARYNLNVDEKEELRNIYRDWFDNDIDRKSIRDQLVTLYADNFTETEINELIVFYKTPLGQKFLQKNPELMRLGAQIGMHEGQAKQHLLLKKLKPFMEKHQ